MADPLGLATRSRPALDHLRDRLVLLSLATSVGRGPFTGIAALWATFAMLVPACAIALGVLVGRVVELGDDGGRVAASALTGPVVAVSGLFFAVFVVARLLVPVRAWLVARVEADLDATVQTATDAATRSHGVSGWEELAANAALATSGGAMFGLASATDAELWLIAHYGGALACAVLLARFSVLAAACVLLAAFGQRELLRHSFAVPYTADAEVVIAADRAAPYWREVTSGRAAARDLRVFGLASRAVAEYTTCEAISAQCMTNMLRRAVPRLWATFMLMGVGAGVSFVVLAHLAVVGQLSIGELVVALGATLGVLRLGVLGEEAFPLQAASRRLAALRSLERGEVS